MTQPEGPRTRSAAAAAATPDAEDSQDGTERLRVEVTSLTDAHGDLLIAVRALQASVAEMQTKSTRPLSTHASDEHVSSTFGTPAPSDIATSLAQIPQPTFYLAAFTPHTPSLWPTRYPQGVRPSSQRCFANCLVHLAP